LQVNDDLGNGSNIKFMLRIHYAGWKEGSRVLEIGEEIRVCGEIENKLI